MLNRLFLICLIVLESCFVYSNNLSMDAESAQEIFDKAKQENLPIIALFLRGPECLWSQKWDQEIFTSDAFRQRIKKEAILWRIDPNEAQQLYQLQESPQLLLLDPQGKEFARLKYKPADPLSYAEEIIDLIDQFEQICFALNSSNEIDEQRWKELYQGAQKLSVPYFKQMIIERGMQKEKEHFFHLEKLAFLIEKYKLKHPQVIKAKKNLLDRDPDNRLGIHFQVAVLEFQKIASSLKPHQRKEKALRPLFRYIRHFKGEKNVWKAELLIAEFLFLKNYRSQALEYAQTAYRKAPKEVKEQVAETVELIKRSL